MPRPLRLVLIALAALVLLALAALGASAALDRPARIMMVSTAVEAPKPEVWAVLTNFDDYDQWNPVITSASGEPVVGTELDLELTLPGHDPEELDAEVLIVRGDRKLRWQDRLVVPGVRDFEYELIIQPVEPGRVVVVQLLRSEGLLAPFTDEEAGREALALIGEALVERLAATG
ncbi:MAG TPA: SRPBCC domain-containing protein [Gaiellaceae bacterium]|nr:SRPBCC domain-containing protein [Gaiellaceae bacterium]